MLKKILKDKIIKYRRDLHQIPELGFKEFKTQAYLKNELLKLGYFVEEVAKTGLIAVKKGLNEGAIAFRSDIDALAVLEKTNLEYASKHKGYMHACGHDAHMSILLGFASYIVDINIKKTILFIFQPAEESPGGAKVIIESGILEKYKVEKIFGLHIFPEIPEGKIGLIDGVLMAQAGELDITIQALSAHGAQPQKGRDGIYIAAQFIQLIQSIVSRSISPSDSAVLTIGKITGGEARNVLANKVILNGTIRAFNVKVYELIKRRIKEIVIGLENMFSVNIDIEIRDMYPALINNTKLFNFMKSFLKSEEIYDLEPLMISEDFSYYLQKIPGYFCLLGSRNEEKGYTYPLHSCYFNFSDEVLFKGVELYIRICQNLDLIV